MEVGGNNNDQSRKGSKHVWTKEEEKAFLNILNDVVACSTL